MKRHEHELILAYEHEARESERRMTRIFLGSVLLSALLVFQLFLFRPVPGAPGRIIRVAFPAGLLWSFVMAGYVFYCLRRLSARGGQVVHEIAAADLKTGVKTLGHIIAVLEEEHEKALKTGEQCTVLYVDLENLDIVNRNFGRAVGDVVLSNVASTIESCIHPGGSVGHVGGDEFVVVLPATGREEAGPVISDIEKGIRHCRLDIVKKGWEGYLGCRIGAAACPGGGESAEDVIRAALQAIYKPGE